MRKIEQHYINDFAFFFFGYLLISIVTGESITISFLFQVFLSSGIFTLLYNYLLERRKK